MFTSPVKCECHHFFLNNLKHVRISLMNQVDLFKNESYSTGSCTKTKKVLKKNETKIEIML